MKDILQKRDRPEIGPNPLRYQGYDIRIRAGDTEWTTNDEDRDKLPRCEVGGWDTHGTWDPVEIIDELLNGSPLPVRTNHLIPLPSPLAPFCRTPVTRGEHLTDETQTRDMDCRWEC